MSTAPVHSLTTTPTEKHDPVELEQASSSKSEDSGHNDIDPEFSPDEQRRIVRRIDKRLIVTCGLMYCVSLMDRTNLSNAAIAGMVVELNLIGFRYVSLHIGFGFPNTWGPMIPLRLILGVLEAGFFPGCVYLISTWYSRYDLQKRYSIFYLIGCLASACSGILAYGLMQMDGLANYSGWRWIFIMEGILTCVVGIIGYFFLVDFPDKAARTSWAFLNERECQFITRRIAKDRGDAELEPFNLKKWAASGLDLKIWGFALMFFSITTQAYAIAYFLPIILHNNMGFSIGAAQCLVAPPYAFAGILMFATSWAGDRWRMRGPVLIFNCFICFVGLPLMGFVKSSGVRYFGVFLTTAGVNANIPAAMAYQANNIRGQWKRAFASATLVGFGGIGGIAGSLIFRSQDAPHYRPGIYAAIACDGLIVVIVGILSIYFRRCNQKVSKGQMVIEGLEGFRYTI
ncbi:hypothetical protein LTR99_004535 [Exophiala xenobiotica]|uniref:Phthalate transporter n=1 Tax=Vermiconidia calcicola TaxID=1690605 RepID=A0AAV9QEJ1_9PEZI|nr:hypothetical protein LTR92_000281 [Exophiala xenobiotica]KAK5304079.1 hypothetical protein LTR99_004535 [Exophiala xenobiotica]KAK5338689.1 hypothetical protein LTR98_005089 [Exophiala xenobiotica]KAK5432771.1 hypothetical protein LTR34_004244 [Exophiala xenobiotica]KAK5539815.1 hypothetical protein LTR25_003520 [Vermiconidia calcicola]